MNSRLLWRALAVSASLSVSFVGCSDQPTEVSPGIAAASIQSGEPLLTAAPIKIGSPVAPDESAAAETIARTLALALSDPALRQQLLGAMSSSGVKEGKLHLSTFLSGHGANIVAAGLARSRLSAVELASVFGRVRDLEFYMPVRSHRTVWKAREVLVAAAMAEDQPPVAFDSMGLRIVLDRKTPPTTPVLVLTPVETDFGSKGRASAKTSIPETRSSLAIAPAQPRFNSLAADPRVRGLYASFIRVLDEKEPWARGDPELEIHIVGKSGTSNGTYRPYQCSGEQAHFAPAQPGIRSTDYWYDQNGRFFEASPGPLLLSPSQVDHIQTWDPAGYFIQFWEDDDTACEIKERNAGDVWRDIIAVAGVVLDHVMNKSIKGVGDVWTLIPTVLTSDSFMNLIIGGDDYIGVAVEKRNTAWAGQYPDNTHVILTRSGELAGRATIALRMYTRSASLGGPGLVEPYQSSTFSATSTGAGGDLRYIWTIKTSGSEFADIVQDGPSSALQYTNAGTSFGVTVNVSDAYGYVGEALMNVSISGAVYPTAPTISGPDLVEPVSSCWWTVSQGSVEASSYEWFVNDVLQSETSTILWYAPGSSAFRIELRVTDTAGQTWTDSHDVSVSYGAPQCPNVQ